MRHIFVILFAFVLLSLPLAACSPTAAPAPAGEPAAAPADAPTTLTIALDLEQRTLDPHSDVATIVTNYSRHMFDTLVRRDNDLNLEGAIAESWENIDPLTWEFKLREGIKFHDGSELTANDVKFSFDRMTDEELALHIRSFVAVIDSTEVVDPLTVHIKTTTPDPLLPKRVTFGAFILPEAAFNEMGAEAFGENPIGSGPYKFVSWERGQQLEMEAFDDYWQGPPVIDRLIWKAIPEASTRVAALKAGEVDIINKLPIQDIQSVEADPNLRVATVPSNRVAFLGFDTFDPPFEDNVALRKAINYAVDVDAIIEHVLGGHATRTLLAPPILFGVDPAIESYPYDLEMARELLAEAGYPDGLEIFVYSAIQGSTPNDTELIQAVCGQLAEVNITCNIQQQEFGSYVQAWLRQEVDGMYLFSFGGPILDLDALMGAHFHSPRRALYYNRPELDALIETAQTSFDEQVRLETYNEIQEMIKEDAPWLFLFAADEVYGLNARVQNYVARADEAVWVYEVDVSE